MWKKANILKVKIASSLAWSATTPVMAIARITKQKEV